MLSDVEDSRYQHVEPRLSIYGRTKDEWAKLAHWALTFDVWSPSARFMVQIPRLYDVYKYSINAIIQLISYFGFHSSLFVLKFYSMSILTKISKTNYTLITSEP